LIGQTVSHYRILEKLGEGGMGVVYLAEDTHLGRRVAIKFLSSADKHYRARFLREARAVSALSHANIAAVFDYGETVDQQPYIVMELVKGKTISELLRAGGFTLAQVVEVTASIAQALAEAHHQGIVHRDIKPSNVILTDRGQVKVLDFGLVKYLNPEQSGTADPEAQTLFATHTRSDVIVGTPLYLSPEQASGKQVDGRTDLFSLGALLYECITGQPAFSGSSVMEIGAQVIHVNPQAPSTINHDVSAELDRITLKALEKTVESRYQSAEEMLRDLRAVLPTLTGDGRPTMMLSSRVTPANTPAPTGAFGTLTQTLKRPRLSLATLIGAILLSGGAVWAAIHFWPRSTHQPTAAAKELYDKGSDALRDGAYYEASTILGQAVKADDQFPLSHARLAEAWSELDSSEQAKDELLRTTELVPDRTALAPIDALYLDAISASVTRHFESAIKAYDGIAGLRPKDAQAYVDLGRAYEQNGNVDKAIENYQKAITLDANYPTAYLRAGIAYMRRPDNAAAGTAFDNAERLYRARENSEGVGEVLRRRGNLLSVMGKYTEANAQFEQALQMANANGYDWQQINTLIDVSNSANTQGLTARAKESAQKAVDLAQLKHLNNLVAGGLIQLGNSYMGGGDYDQAEKYFKQATESARENKGKRNEAVGLRNLGGLYVTQLRTDEGLTLIQQALALFRAQNYFRDVAVCNRQIARVNRRKGDYGLALKALDENLQLAQQSDQPTVALSYGEIGAVLSDQERYPEALAQYDKAYEINKTLGNRLNIAYNQANRGEILWKLGRYPEAEQALSDAQVIASQPDSLNKPLVPEIERVYSQMALSERNFPEAKKRAEQALALAGTQYRNVTIEAKSTLGLAKALTGSAGEGKSLCQDSVTLVTYAGDAALASRAMLTLAEVLFANGEYQAALDQATQAQTRFAKSGQQESEWRASFIAALAAEHLGDQSGGQEHRQHAKETIGQLQQKWGTSSFNLYVARPDVQVYYKQLG
jgi:tetratricopeptide (TPR) repeat protein